MSWCTAKSLVKKQMIAETPWHTESITIIQNLVVSWVVLIIMCVSFGCERISSNCPLNYTKYVLTCAKISVWDWRRGVKCSQIVPIMWAYALDLSLPVSVSQSMQDCICGDISGAVIANKKLSVILNRENNTEVGQTSMAPTIREDRKSVV